MLETESLFGVKPISHVDGFTIETTLYKESIFENPADYHLCVPYYYGLTVICDGTNPYYGPEGYIVVLITQKVTPLSVTVRSKEALLLFDPGQRIKLIEMVETDITKVFGAWLKITIEDDYELTYANVLVQELLQPKI